MMFRPGNLGHLGRLGLAAAAVRQLFDPQLEFFSNGEQGGWYDPSDLSTLFQDSAGTTPVTAVEQPVGLMLDKSGRGNHAFQPTVTARPIFRKLGDRGYLDFDGIDDRLSTGTIANEFGKPFFSCAAIQAVGLNGGASATPVFGGFMNTSNRADLAVRLSAAARAAVYVRQVGGTQTVLTLDGVFSDFLPHTVSGVFGGGVLSLRTDGVFRGSFERLIETPFSGPLVVGDINGQSNRFFGGVYVISPSVPEARIAGFEKWLAAKTGVAL